MIAVLSILAVALLALAVMDILRGRDRAAFKTLGALVIVMCTLAGIGCGDTFINVGAPTQTQVIGATPAPAASGSPAPNSGACTVASTTVNAFGERCGPGIAPSTGQREVRVGCDLAVTVNPRRPDGSVIFDLACTGNTPERFEQLSGGPNATFTQDSGNGFNGNLRGLAPGPTVLVACVRGVCSQPTTFTVVP